MSQNAISVSQLFIFTFVALFWVTVIYGYLKHRERTPFADQYPLRTDFTQEALSRPAELRFITFIGLWLLNWFSPQVILIANVYFWLFSLSLSFLNTVLPFVTYSAFIDGLSELILKPISNNSFIFSLSYTLFETATFIATLILVYKLILQSFVIYAGAKQLSEIGKPATLERTHLRYSNKHKGFPPTTQQAKILAQALDEVEARAKENNLPFVRPQYIYVTKDGKPNAFVTTHSLFVSNFLLSQPQTINAIIAHEIGHLVCNHPYFTASVASLPIIIFTDRVEKFIEKKPDDLFDRILSYGNKIIFWFIDVIANSTLRQMEYDADAYAVTLGYGQSLTSSLMLFDMGNDNMSVSIAKRTHPYTQERVIRIEHALEIDSPALYIDTQTALVNSPSDFQFPTVAGFVPKYGHLTTQQAIDYVSSLDKAFSNEQINKLFPKEPVYPKQKEYTSPDEVDYLKPVKIFWNKILIPTTSILKHIVIPILMRLGNLFITINDSSISKWLKIFLYIFIPITIATIFYVNPIYVYIILGIIVTIVFFHQSNNANTKIATPHKELDSSNEINPIIPLFEDAVIELANRFKPTLSDKNLVVDRVIKGGNSWTLSALAKKYEVGNLTPAAIKFGSQAQIDFLHAVAQKFGLPNALYAPKYLPLILNYSDISASIKTGKLTPKSFEAYRYFEDKFSKEFGDNPYAVRVKNEIYADFRKKFPSVDSSTSKNLDDYPRQDNKNINIAALIGMACLILSFILSYQGDKVVNWFTTTKKDIDTRYAAFMATATPIPTPTPTVDPRATVTPTPRPTATAEPRVISGSLPRQILLKGVTYQVSEPKTPQELKACEGYRPCGTIEWYEGINIFSGTTRNFCVTSLIKQNNNLEIRQSFIGQLKSDNSLERAPFSDDLDEIEDRYREARCNVDNRHKDTPIPAR